MNRLPEFAVARPTIIVTLVILLVSSGIFRFATMPRREDPEFTLKICVVTTRWNGATAEQVERHVTDPLEKAIQGLEEVRLIRSNSLSEQSVIFVELEEWVPGAKVDDSWDRVRARVENVQMPDQDIVPLVNDEFADTSVIVFAVHQQPLEGSDSIDPRFAYTQRELDDYSERIRDALLLLPGVAKVERHGVMQEAIYVESSAQNWSQLRLTSDYVQQLADSQNIIAPGGVVDSDDGRLFVRPDGNVDAVEQINLLAVGTVSSAGTENQVTVRDLGLNVRRGYVDPPQRICRYGSPTMATAANTISVAMKSGANIVEICESSKQRVAQLSAQGELPPDVAVSVISDQSVSVNQRIRDVMVNIVQAIIIVVIVVYLFVGFRIAAVMAANIPFVVFVSLAIIPFFNVQLEQMSLASMIIALGLLVDNAVQICDQAATNQRDGMNPRDAAVKGAQLLGPSMLNGTLTTIAAFAPMLIALEGSSGEFIYSLPVTLSVMLGVSWVLAMTFCVILAAWYIRAPGDGRQSAAPLPWLFGKLKNFFLRTFSRRKKTDEGADTTPSVGAADSGDDTGGSFFFDLYGAILGWTLKHPFATLATAFGMLVLIMQLPVSAEFFPLTERNQFAVNVYLPESASFEQTNKIARQVEDAIRKVSPWVDEEGVEHERLRNMRTVVGGGGSRWYLSWEPEFIQPNFAEILVHTTDGKLTHEFAESLRKAVQEGNEELGIEPIVGARVVPIELLLGPPADPVVLRVVGDGYADMKQLRSAADRVKQMIEDQPETWDVNDSWGVATQQLFVDVADDRTGVTGVRNSEIASSLDAFYSGRFLTHYREANRLIPVYFRLRPEDRKSIADMQTSYIETSSGKIPLSALADIVPQWRPSRIERRNGNRTIEVRSQIQAGASGNDITSRIFKSEQMDRLREELPLGMRVEIGGALEESEKAQWQMLSSFGMSFIAIILLLIIQFNSVFRMTIIVFTLPLALGGALLGLWLTTNPLGFMPQLGILALFGIVLNAAILFVEFADQMIRQRKQQQGNDERLSKEDVQAAIISAGRQRLTPIFLTTATTVGGLLPLALFGGPLWVGMAWLLVFGLSYATLLTLIIIPVLYSFSRQ
ncbi:efflux RND transporter permease subunit [Mariniblastus fucicola]|uniref:Multidrug export protein AcrF n=1 Tax=Mariniblastus fucicola TaxID=980251 RepID=A0A5B9PBB1_9BACT|nr:efflux RND transporter permease subunit [Mariniblastus fucicola]QEG20403.1 Multidrug export protein AcrF [Mariniblastus fucicola]